VKLVGEQLSSSSIRNMSYSGYLKSGAVASYAGEMCAVIRLNYPENESMENMYVLTESLVYARTPKVILGNIISISLVINSVRLQLLRKTICFHFQIS